MVASRGNADIDPRITPVCSDRAVRARRDQCDAELTGGIGAGQRVNEARPGALPPSVRFAAQSPARGEPLAGVQAAKPPDGSRACPGLDPGAEPWPFFADPMAAEAELILAQVSRRPTVRLNTSRSGVLSGSAQK
jgi:hypothetical protein